MRSINLTGANQALGVVPAPFLYYRGFQVRETTGAASALFVVYDGTSATGTILDEVALIANESAREIYAPPKIAKIGIYVSIVSGAIAGSINID